MIGKLVSLLAGLGDALGVDWASLVADVRRREQTSVSSGGARDHWRPERVLARLGLSLHMAGKEVVQDILQKNAESLHDKNQVKQSESTESKDNIEVNGIHDQENQESKSEIESLHPVAAIQVRYSIGYRVVSLEHAVTATCCHS